MIRTTFIFLLLFIFFIITIPFIPILLIIGLFSKTARDKIAFALVRAVFKIILFITGSKVEITGKENLPKDQPVLYIGNHNSLLDVVIGYILVPDLTGFIAKKELMKVPGLNWWMLLMNCLFLDRKNTRSGLEIIKTASDYIKNGISIFVFPEGTRSRTGELADFKEGTFKIATLTKCQIIPIAFTGTADIFENHFPKVKPSHVTVTIGAPINTAELSRAEQKKLGATTKELIAEMISKKQ
ncbi:MAG: 1-acyl-sn-glycerol-3-phosphate acyltransferase [Lachnospiraceae bacterium]|nr:1-acyl-sn-glycerol-3-phosphate acyltransferase [Lachnospiraceae bacterium]